MSMKDWMTTVEAAEKWGISRQRALKLVKDGRVTGAYFDEQVSLWLVPVTAKNPAAKKPGPVPKRTRKKR